MEEPKKMDLRSIDITTEHRAKLKQIFPHVFNEDKIDFERLKQTLGEDIDAGLERFGLTWPGKAECMKIIQQPSIGTLKPCKEESVNFDSTENLFIEGDNLEVLKLLQKSYYGKVKMIYIDPPYNTGNEFIYPDKYSESLETYLTFTGQIDDAGKKFSTNTETDGRFHSKWLNMMYPRIFLARNLLKENGVIFISIDDGEVSHLRKLCDEVFGEENFIGCIARKSKLTSNSGTYFSPAHEYILVYGKSLNLLDGFDDTEAQEDEDYINLFKYEDEYSKYNIVGLYQPSLTLERSRNARYFIQCPDGTKCIPPENKRWRVIESSYLEMLSKGLIVFKETKTSPLFDEKGVKSKWNIYTKIYFKDRLQSGMRPVTFLDKYPNSEASKELIKMDIPFDFSKPKNLIKYLLKIINSADGDIILDFFSGSGTTAHAVLELNNQDKAGRKFICVQLPEICEDVEASKAGFKTIADIGKERIRRAIKKIQNESKELLNFQNNKMDLGFKVFKLDQSNFKIWDGSVEKASDGKVIEKQLELQIEHINLKATEEEILYELLLKSGFALTTKVEILQMAGKRVYSIENGALLVCLEKNLTKEVITEMARKEPARVICLDAGFSGNDQLKTNAVQIMKSHKVEDFRTV